MSAIISTIDTFAESRGVSLAQGITDRAKELAKRALRSNFRGHSKDVLVSTLIFAACREEGVRRSMTEICAMTSVSKVNLQKCYKALKRCLNLRMAIVEVVNFIPRLCQALDMSNRRHVQACENLSEVLNTMQQGKNPNSIAAASVFFIARKTNPTLKLSTICEHAGSSLFFFGFWVNLRPNFRDCRNNRVSCHQSGKF